MLKNIVYIAAIIAAFALLWIAFSIKHNLDTSTIPPETHANIIPITPGFDTTTLNQLKDRTAVPIDLNASPIITASSSGTKQTTIITPTPTQSLSETIPIASNNATTR